MMKLAIGTLLAAAALALAAPAAAQQAEEEEMSMVARAIHADGRLWLLTDDGKLARVSDGASQAVAVALPGQAVDLCRHEGRPLVATADRRRPRFWTLRRLSGERWATFAAVQAEREDLVGLACGEDEVALLTSRRLIVWRGPRAKAVRLSTPVYRGYVASNLYSEGGSLFVGLNNGEWGGGVRRIAIGSGRVRTIERIDRGGACGEPLDTGCDPVNGFAAIPWKPGCVAAAIGLVHFLPRGRLVELCGDRVEQLYSKPEKRDWPEPEQGWGDDGYDSVAFFGLVRRGGSLWAAGIDGVYELRGEGEPAFRPMPEFRQVGGFWLSDDLPDFILVATDIARRASVSASSPLLVAREETAVSR